MLVNSVKIQPTGQEGTWIDMGYAFLVSLEAKLGDRAQQGQATIGEIVVAADTDGLTVMYEKDKRTYELKLNLLGESPEIIVEDVTEPKKML